MLANFLSKVCADIAQRKDVRRKDATFEEIQ